MGSKRLASMPDRITNTINVVGSDLPVCRPTVINMYDGDLSTLQLWWSAWEKFMFDTPLTIQGKDGTFTEPPYKMLQPIKKAKYPDITEEEEKVSLPLQKISVARINIKSFQMPLRRAIPKEYYLSSCLRRQVNHCPKMLNW